MNLYHATTVENAKVILLEGFRDGRGSYGTDRGWSGVWLSNMPLDENEGADGDALLEIELPDGAAASLADYEWTEDGKVYREWLIPAAVLTPLISRLAPACFSENRRVQTIRSRRPVGGASLRCAFLQHCFIRRRAALDT